MPSDSNRIHAYEIHAQADMPIVIAPIERDWMDATDRHFAYRCLPLVIANQAGWLIQNPTSFIARWTGGVRKEDVAIECDEQPADARILSHFGSGVVTISLPYLFRTPHGTNLWVKGPSNWIKDGAQALEGVVESDWSPATFTMNWKLTRPGHAVRFERGEPICMIMPIPRGLAESLEPLYEPLANNPELEAEYRRWDVGRRDFLQSLDQQNTEALLRGWQKDYFQGHTPAGDRFDQHQTRLHLKEFVGPDGAEHPAIPFPSSRTTDAPPRPFLPRGDGVLPGSTQSLAPTERSKCVILVPVAHHIEPDCDRALRELEARGYPVWRIWGYSQIDVARSQMASDALARGFDELFWIDADIAFDPDDVDQLRSRCLPVLCALYPKKGHRAIACHSLPEMKQLTFGQGGGIVELRYGATGFLLTRRQVYEDIQQSEQLPVCNQRFSKPIVPYFLPMFIPDGAGHWYLGEDFAFFERVRRCGYQVLADTTVRLQHIGTHGFSWEEAGASIERFTTYVLKLDG